MSIGNIEEWSRTHSGPEYYVVNLTARRLNELEEPTRPPLRARRTEAFGPFRDYDTARSFADSGFAPGTVLQIGYRDVPGLEYGDSWTVV
jgi:hypothetical protein